MLVEEPEVRVEVPEVPEVPEVLDEPVVPEVRVVVSDFSAAFA